MDRARGDPFVRPVGFFAEPKMFLSYGYVCTYVVLLGIDGNKCVRGSIFIRHIRSSVSKLQAWNQVMMSCLFSAFLATATPDVGSDGTLLQAGSRKIHQDIPKRFLRPF